jgi:predicted acyltransferase
MIVIPVPEFGAGVLEPGSNLAAWIDNKIIPFHMYQGTWDPEGLLSTIPAVVTGISGMIAGHLIVSNKNINEKIILLFVGGAFAIIAGEVWSWSFPINKNLWTSSYVLYTSGLASIAWAILIWVMDIKKYINWGKPAIVFGSNAIIAYILLYIIGIPLTYIPISGNHGIQELYMESLINIGLLPELISLSWAVIYTALCYIPVLILYKKRIFLKI